MARKRVIYQSEGLYVGTTSGNGHNENLNNGSTIGTIARVGATPDQLYRVQSINYGFDIPRQDVNQFGQLARIDQVILEQPTVDLDFSYYTETGYNESRIGFHVGGSNALSHFLDGSIGKVNAETSVPGSNYYVRVTAEGNDLNIGNETTDKVIGMGNMFVSNFTAEASVGSFPTTSITAEGMNMKFYSAGQGTNVAHAVPSVKPSDGSSITQTFQLPAATQHEAADQPTALRPGDVKIGVTSLGLNNRLWRGVDASELKVQSFSISADMSRENLERLGSKFAYSKELEFPLTATLTLEAIVSDLVADDIEDIVNDDDSAYDAMIKIYAPNNADDFTPGDTNHAIAYTMKNMKTDSLSFSSSIGDNKTVSLTATAQMGAKDDTNNGLFISATGVTAAAGSFIGE